MNRREFLSMIATAPAIAAMKPWRPVAPSVISTPSATWTLTFPKNEAVALTSVAIIRHNIAPMYFECFDGTKSGPFDHYLKSAAWP